MLQHPSVGAILRCTERAAKCFYAKIIGECVERTRPPCRYTVKIHNFFCKNSSFNVSAYYNRALDL